MKKQSQTYIENGSLMRTLIKTELSSILASNVRHSANSKWFDCLSIRVRHIPSYGFIQIHYDFNEIEEKLIFNHRLVISEISMDNIDNSIRDNLYDFKLTFENKFRIDKIYLLGRQLSNQEEINADSFSALNAIHYLADNQELLIATDWSTSRIIFTTDKREIIKFKNEYLITNNGNLKFELLELDIDNKSN